LYLKPKGMASVMVIVEFNNGTLGLVSKSSPTIHEGDFVQM